MGVGKYNVTRETTPTNLDYSGAAYNYNYAGGPPPGVTTNPFDQTTINWNMAQKYAAENAQHNRNIAQQYAEAFNQWQNNGQRGPAPNQPAQYATDPTALFQHFNSSVPGILLQGGRVINNTGNPGAVDPIALMFQNGTANPAGPAYATPSAPANTGLQDFGKNLPPQPSMGPYPATTGPQPATPQPAPTQTAQMPPMAQNPAPNPAGQVNNPQPSTPYTGAAPSSDAQWQQTLQYNQRFNNPYSPRVNVTPAPVSSPQQTVQQAATTPTAGGRAATNPTGQRPQDMAPSPYVAPQQGNRQATPNFSLQGRNNYSGWSNRGRGY